MAIQDSAPSYFSRFGGTWTDRDDAADELERRLSDGRISAAEADQLRGWMAGGYVILEGAVPAEVCDRFREDISRAWEQGDERLLVQHPGGAGHEPLRGGERTDRSRVVDSYAFYGSAREALFAPAIVRWLQVVFDAPPMLFQSLSFDKGSQQGMHQDTAYVVTASPLELAASWIALEDIQEGSGELMYYEGSHRLPEYAFSGEHKHWNPERDGSEQHEDWARLLNENAEKMGLARRTFLPRKGDVLIWAADLAHGGSPATDETLTRRSLVGHYCPVANKPNWFNYRDDRFTRVPYGDGWFTSEYYDLSGEDGAQDARESTPELEPRPAPASAGNGGERSGSGGESAGDGGERPGLLGRLFGR